MSAPRQMPPRFAEIATAVVVLAIPMTLIAATWTPLEPPPSRAGRANSAEPIRVDDRSVDDPGGSNDEEERRARRANRERAGNPEVATPRP